MAQYEVYLVFSLTILKYKCKWLHFFCKQFLNDTQFASFHFTAICTLDLVQICGQILFEPKCYSCKILFEPKCYFLPNHADFGSSSVVHHSNQKTKENKKQIKKLNPTGHISSTEFNRVTFHAHACSLSRVLCGIVD